MEDILIDSRVSIIGAKEVVVSILCRVLDSLEKVNGEDSIDVINRKIRSVNAKMADYHTEFTLMDFLDSVNRMESPCKDYVLSFIDDEEPDGSEDYGIVLKEVQEDGMGCTLVLDAHVYGHQGSYTGSDWHDWCRRMVGLYGVRISLVQDFNGIC